MCYNCGVKDEHGNWKNASCFCNGGGVFALCPCEKGQHCSQCGHEPMYGMRETSSPPEEAPSGAE